MKTMSKKMHRIFYTAVILLSVAFIVLGYWFCTRNGNILGQEQTGSAEMTCKARAEEIISDNQIYSKYTNEVTERRIVYYATILNGEKKGERIVATQVMDQTQMELGQPVQPGKVHFVSLVTNEYMENQWMTGNPVRTAWLALLVFGFCGLVILFGRGKGVNTIIALVLTCLAIFFVMIPAIANGFNIYASALIICAFTILTTHALVSGFTFKSLAAILGCMGGVGIAGIITIVSSHMMQMTGMTDDDSLLIYVMNPDKPIDLRAILFTGIIIGALGAVMDVGMSISSSLAEIIAQVPGITFGGILKSGFAIGRDIMGTMANTLVLAYIGSGLHMTLLLLTYRSNLEEILNMEMIASEVLQAMAGSIAILFTIPTTAIATAFFHKKFTEGESLSETEKTVQLLSKEQTK